MGRLRAGVLVVALAALGARPLPTDAADSPPTVADVVAGLKATYAKVTSVRADFNQVRHDVITGKDERMRGRFAAKRPRKMRVEILPPNAVTVVADGTHLSIYTPKQNQVVVMKDLGGAASSMGVLLDDFDRIDTIFDVALVPEKPPVKLTHTLTLKPKQAGAAPGLRLTLSKQKFLMQNLVIEDQAGGSTEMNFLNIRLNPDLPDSEFVFVPPPGVQVIQQ